MRNLEPYRKLINKISQEYQLPVFIKGGLPLDENPAIAAVFRLLDLASTGKKGLVWHDVIALWQSPYFDWSLLSPGNNQENHRHLYLREAKQLSEIARWGSVIQGYEQWKETFERLIGFQADSGGQTNRSSIPGHIPTGESADKLWKKFKSFVNLITPPKDGLSVDEYLLWVENLLGDFNLDEERIRGLNFFQDDAEWRSGSFSAGLSGLKKIDGIVQ